ncbi:hypothetical protein [Methanobrevibacter sp.]|uniref:hypothetical protein n=1 Tax=Methanobrevibacter sp. TaxID=66852 RepID=UPI00388D4D3A
MKGVLEKYLNQQIKLKTKKNDDTGYTYTLISVADNYFALNNHAITYEEHNYYIPYTSIFQISEKDFGITIELNNLDDLIELTNKLTDDLNSVKEEICNVKGCIIGNSAALGELMRQSTEINSELDNIQNKMDNINRSINSVETSIRYI